MAIPHFSLLLVTSFGLSHCQPVDPRGPPSPLEFHCQSPRHCGSRKIGECRLVKSCPFFRSARVGEQMHQRNVRERWRGCGNMRQMGLGKMGNLSRIVPFFSMFSPISHQFHTFFFFYICCNVFWAISQVFPLFPHSPPFSSISPILPSFFPFSHFSEPPASGRLIRLRPARTLESP